MSIHEQLTEDNKREPRAPIKDKKWEDDYTRGTYYIENKTMDDINYFANNRKGEKTRIANEALQLWVELEKAGIFEYADKKKIIQAGIKKYSK